MMSLLFGLFLLCMIFALSDKEKMSFAFFGIGMVLSVVWFLHHATSKLDIQL